MTTEDDFQRALDADPTDWQTRLVFADWLQERGDDRAEGYRALGVMRARPCSRGESIFPPDHEFAAHYQFWWCNVYEPMYDPFRLPHDWDARLENRFADSRRGAEDGAARAFSKLPAKRRAKLLACGTGTDAVRPKKAKRKRTT